MNKNDAILHSTTVNPSRRAPHLTLHNLFSSFCCCSFFFFSFVVLLFCSFRFVPSRIVVCRSPCCFWLLSRYIIIHTMRVQQFCSHFPHRFFFLLRFLSPRKSQLFSFCFCVKQPRQPGQPGSTEQKPKNKWYPIAGAVETN